jgi:hypothetical protein
MLSGNIKNVLPQSGESVPVAEPVQVGCRGKRITKEIVESLAIEKYGANGKGITIEDITTKCAVKKSKAQRSLKYFHSTGVVFTANDLIREGILLLQNKNPQEYFAACMKAEILENLKNRKSVPVQPTGISSIILPDNSSISPLSQCLQFVTIQTLEGYVLPLLAEAPLFVHNMHFKTRVITEYYDQIKLPNYKKNNGKHHQEIIGSTLVDYVIYKGGTVVIQTTCSNNPYKLETEEDRFRLIEFFGQIRAGLINLLHDKHERIVSDVLEWELTQCDINKDIKVTDLLHLSAVKIQVKHLDHLFRIYIKALGNDTVCRIEENKQPKKRAVEFINDVFNPMEKIEKQLSGISEQIDKLAGFQGSLDDGNCDLTRGP